MTRSRLLLAAAWLLAACGSSATTTSDAGLGAADATTPDDDAAPGPDAAPSEVPRQAYIWVWRNYGDSLDAIVAHASSFTHVSPAFYELNFDYQSGPAHIFGDDFDG